MFGPESGYEVVINEKVPYPPSDCTASILKLKEAGCDVMFLELSPPGCARIIKDASRLGVYPDMKAIVSHNYCGRDVCDLAGEAGVGAYSATTSGPYFEEKEPSVVKLSQALQKYEGETEVESYDMMPCYGALPMLTFIEACQRGLDHIGYDQMNGETGRQEIYNQLCAMRNCDMGGVGHEISFAPNDRRGSHYLDIVVMEPANDVIPERHWLDISGWLEMPLLSLDQIEEIQKHEIK
jgi:ABC-type branched-subunit amino acid transport system substrate-binding protein